MRLPLRQAGGSRATRRAAALVAFLGGALAVTACAAGLPKAPPPPTTSRGAAAVPTTRPRRGTSTSAATSTSTSTSTTVAAAATTTTVPQANVSYDPDAVATYAIGPQPSNWNIHAAAAAPSYTALEQVLAQVWPSAFDVGASGVAELDTSLLDSAQEVSTSPQRIVYQINPRAVWSDGTPITYLDFAYNWQAQSAKAVFADTGGKPYTPMDVSGYDDIASVTGSPADPYTVTVVFSKPFAGWRSLFSYLVPAHVGQAVGFDHGFTDPVTDLVSGGPFLISELQEGYSLQLVRNAHYWESPANLASVTYYFTTSTAEMANAVAAGQLDVAALEASPSEFDQMQGTSGMSVQAVASSLYEDLDFNEAAGPFASALLREAVMLAVDRSAMATTVLGGYGLAAKPVENRVLLPGEPGYFPNGSSFDQPAPSTALDLLSSAGYTGTGGALRYPGTGLPVAVNLVVSSADPVAAQLAAVVESSCAAIGLKVTVVTTQSAIGYVAGQQKSLRPPPGWQMAIELRQVPVPPLAIEDQYLPGGTANLDGYSSGSMDALLTELGTAPAAELPSVYDQVDALAWTDFVDLPLVQVPVVIAVNKGLLNLQAGPYYGNVGWDEQDWGFAS